MLSGMNKLAVSANVGGVRAGRRLCLWSSYDSAMVFCSFGGIRKTAIRQAIFWR
jgi:hypothetical protein